MAVNPGTLTTTPVRPRFRVRPLALLALAAAAGHVHAQTIPAAVIDEPLLGDCRTSLEGQPGLALVLAGRILARESLSPVLEAGAVGCLAQAQRLLGDSAGAEASTRQLLHALTRPSLARDVRLAGLQEAAELLQWNGQYSSAAQLLEQMRDEAIEAQDVNGQINALAGLALIRGEQLGDHEGALLYLQHAVALADLGRRPPTRSDVDLQYRYGYTLLALQRPQEAGKALQRAAAIAARLPDQQRILQRIASDGAEILRIHGDIDKADARLREVARWQQQRDPQGQVITLQRLALIRLDQQQTDAALALAEQAQTLAEQAHYRDELRRGLELLADVHAARGEHARARDYARRGRDMDRSSIRGESLNALAKLQAGTEAITSRGQPVDDPQVRRDRHVRNAALIASGLLLVVSVLLFAGDRRRRRQVHRLRAIDLLTGLLNRRELERRVAALPGSGRHTAILLLDIDTFKQINERCGHLAGDRILAAVAQRLREACDPDDLIARWGGEEFVIVRHDTGRAAAFALADQLRACIERLQVDTGTSPLLPLSASVGVAPLALFDHTPARLQDGIRLAEQALAVAKASGSNAWAGLWGGENGASVDMLQVIRDPAQALAQHWITVDANRHTAWESLRASR